MLSKEYSNYVKEKEKIKYLKIKKRHFENIYPKQMEDFYSKVNVEGDYVNIPYTSKSLNMTRSNPSKKIVGISMFSGAGGLDIGAYLAGIDIKYASDINKDCVETLRLNNIFNDVVTEAIDINDIDIDKIKSDINLKKDEKMFLIGGPPCQPFSKAAYWVTNDKRDSFNDKRNMIPAYFRIVDELEPDFVLMENVSSILHASNIQIVEYIEEEFERLGYIMKYYNLNSADYGLPQKRRRVFFIASKYELDIEFEPFRSDKKGSDLPLYEPVVNWIGDFNLPQEKIEGKWGKELTEIPPGKNYIALSERDGHPNPRFKAGKRYWSSLLKLSPLLPSWTIIASPGHWEGPFHWENKRLTNRESAAIQTFPTDYKFHGSARVVRRQIGNAVPPLLARFIFEEIIKCIK